jgi:hypothetical protein
VCWTIWAAYYEFAQDIGCSLPQQPLDLYLSWCKSQQVVAGNKQLCFVHRKPQIAWQEGRLHNTTGPAVQYPDGWGWYAVHGVPVPRELITDPETNTTQVIEGETNAELRRIRIELYGFERYLRDARVECVQQDDFGKLYKRQVSDDEPALAFVKVVNSTPEPDGSYKTYVLPCRSSIMTAHEAVAQSFGLDIAEYNPSFQS